MSQSSSSLLFDTPICRAPRPSALGFASVPPAFSASSFLGAAAGFLGAPNPPPPAAFFAGLALASIDSAESPRGLAAAQAEPDSERSEMSAAAGAKEYPVTREAQAMSASGEQAMTEGEGRILERGITGARQIF
eukprot:CAMPEP_0180285026 /NCGR_PEP_ID=MMETSP0988-20121125/11659_1 /TAXON_ID=697907 /ORGANISM="non described non described, Strain CCMP2293" /LENGTH=133 /DNA_ID=CAMNT_0022258337 /DNA_START=192 /DNA_END=590 /DNA_ORIENTATION=+